MLCVIVKFTIHWDVVHWSPLVHMIKGPVLGYRRASVSTARLPDRQARERDDARILALAKLASKQVNRVAQQRQKQLADQDALIERAKELQPFSKQVVEYLQKGSSVAGAGQISVQHHFAWASNVIVHLPVQLPCARGDLRAYHFRQSCCNCTDVTLLQHRSSTPH